MGNKLSDLWDAIFQARIDKQKKAFANRFTQGFAGQHTNPTRQSKLRMMHALHIKTGKQYRKYIKGVRAENRRDAAKVIIEEAQA
jgi:hypothetical protein